MRKRVRNFEPNLIFYTKPLLGNKQEQTKFDDLRRGITKDWQSLKRTMPKIPPKITYFRRFAFLTFFDLQMTSKLKFDLIRPTQFRGARDFQFHKIFCLNTP